MIKDLYLKEDLSETSIQDLLVKDKNIRLHITSYGGEYPHVLKVLNHWKIHNIKAHVFVEGIAASASAIVALGGTKLTVVPGSMLMFHWHKTEYDIKTAERGEEFADNRQYMNILKQYCRPFLSDYELRKMRKHQPIYIHSDDDHLQIRIKRHFRSK